VTEEQRKDFIFDTFSKCRSEPGFDRIKAKNILCDQIFRWYRNYLKIDVDEAGLAIVKVIIRFLKEETISKIPQDKDGFFKYLTVSINKEKAGFYREYNKKDTIKIPREKKKKLRDVEDFNRSEERRLGRKLTNDEIMQGVSKFFNKQEYIDLYNATNVKSTSYINKNGNGEIDDIDVDDPNSIDLLNEYINKTDMENVLKAVKSLLDKKQKRVRDCYRAFFTLYCIKNFKDFEKLNPVLDSQILETWRKDGKKPKQYEIYQKYHPNAQKSSTEAMASKNLSEFLKDIETCLKENK
jgi:hypothetical protein